MRKHTKNKPKPNFSKLNNFQKSKKKTHTHPPTQNKNQTNKMTKQNKTNKQKTDIFGKHSIMSPKSNNNGIKSLNSQ